MHFFAIALCCSISSSLLSPFNTRSAAAPFLFPIIKLCNRPNRFQSFSFQVSHRVGFIFINIARWFTKLREIMSDYVREGKRLIMFKSITHNKPLFRIVWHRKGSITFTHAARKRMRFLCCIFFLLLNKLFKNSMRVQQVYNGDQIISINIHKF